MGASEDVRHRQRRRTPPNTATASRTSGSRGLHAADRMSETRRRVQSPPATRDPAPGRGARRRAGRGSVGSQTSPGATTGFLPWQLEFFVQCKGIVVTAAGCTAGRVARRRTARARRRADVGHSNRRTRPHGLDSRQNRLGVCDSARTGHQLAPSPTGGPLGDCLIFGSVPGEVPTGQLSRIRWRSKGKPARPYICRFRV